jgi:hypothetical protein
MRLTAARGALSERQGFGFYCVCSALLPGAEQSPLERGSAPHMHACYAVCSMQQDPTTCCEAAMHAQLHLYPRLS